MERIFSEKLWNQYVSKVEERFKLKTYPQFDPYFNFPQKKNQLYNLLSDPDLQLMKSHEFIPLVKIIMKTPRYRWQEDKSISEGGKYQLETKSRPISFASHFDTYVYGFYAFALNVSYQNYIHKNGFEESVLAYRTDLGGKCNIQFAKEVFDQIASKVKSNEECSVITLDIKGYFDHIDHSILRKMWCKIIDEPELPIDQFKVFRSLTKYSYVNYNSFLKHFKINLKKSKKQFKNKLRDKKSSGSGMQSLLDLISDEINGKSFHEKMQLLRNRKLICINRNKDRTFSSNGIPQGSAMSAVLSNLYLIDFDKKIVEKGRREGFIYRRYCDDLIVVCEPDKVNDLKMFLMDLIKNKYKLTIQDKKTDVVDFRIDSQGAARSYKRDYDKKNKTFNSVETDTANFKNLQYLGFEFNGKNVYIRSGSLSRYFRKMKAKIKKTVLMAYSSNSVSDTIFKKNLIKKYSHIGKNNFLTYAYNSSEKSYFNSRGEEKEGMNSPSIRKQLARHMEIMKFEIEKTSEQIAHRKKVEKIKY